MATLPNQDARTFSWRSNLSLLSFNYVGIGCSNHCKFQIVTVVIFASAFTPLHNKPRLASIEKNKSKTELNDTDDEWPNGAVSMKEKCIEEVKNGKKYIRRVQTFKMSDGTTQKRELTEAVKLN